MAVDDLGLLGMPQVEGCSGCDSYRFAAGYMSCVARILPIGGEATEVMLLEVPQRCS